MQIYFSMKFIAKYLFFVANLFSDVSSVNLYQIIEKLRNFKISETRSKLRHRPSLWHHCRTISLLITWDCFWISYYQHQLWFAMPNRNCQIFLEFFDKIPGPGKIKASSPFIHYDNEINIPHYSCQSHLPSAGRYYSIENAAT